MTTGRVAGRLSGRFSHAVLLAACLAATACSRTPENPPEPLRDGPDIVTLRIVSTNDIHGALTPTLASDFALNPDPVTSARLGGVDFLAGTIAKIRAQAPDKTIVVDAGDCSQGDYAVNASEGMFCASFFNAVGYTARTIGNHEFDYLDVGQDEPLIDPRGALKRAAAAAKQPIVLANAHLEDGSPVVAAFREFAIVDVAGVKVGFTGIITPSTPTVSRRAGSVGVVFEQPVDALRRVLPKMRAAGATVVIVLTHLGGVCQGRADDKVLPGAPPCALNGELAAIQAAFTRDDIDLVFSGHDHVVLRGDGPVIPVVENPGQGVSVGLVEIDVDRATGRRVGDARVLPHVPVCPPDFPGAVVCKGSWPGYIGPVEADQAVAGLRRATEELVAAECADVVATATADITFYRGTEPPLALLAVDLLRELGVAPDGKGRGADAVLAFMNRGSTRGSLAAGPVTMCDIARVWPFTDPPVAVTLTGQEVIDMMTFLVDDVKKAPVISGFKVSRVDRGPLTLTLDDGRPVAPEKAYRLVTTKYLQEGGDRMDEFFARIPADRFEAMPLASYRDAFVTLLRARGRVSPPDNPRYTGVTRE